VGLPLSINWRSPAAAIASQEYHAANGGRKQLFSGFRWLRETLILGMGFLLSDRIQTFSIDLGIGSEKDIFRDFGPADFNFKVNLSQKPPCPLEKTLSR